MLPSSSGDSFLLLVLWGEAPWSSRLFTFCTSPALTASVSGVSPPTAVLSSRPGPWAATATDTAQVSGHIHRVHVGRLTWQVSRWNPRCWLAEWAESDITGYFRGLLRSAVIRQKPLREVFLGGLIFFQAAIIWMMTPVLSPLLNSPWCVLMLHPHSSSSLIYWCEVRGGYILGLDLIKT